jgi:tRNA(Arg) A34 adenosine deaminase TadA
MEQQLTLSLPEWTQAFLADWQKPLQSDEDCMLLAIALARENLVQATGGPFGAVVVDQSQGELLGVGINLVTSSRLSIAHAEVVALALAQQTLGDWHLGRARVLTLATSCEPCAMCYGAIPWAGVRILLCGARKADAEAAGFDEGDKPADWSAALERRQVAVRCDILREEAAEVLRYYRAAGGEIYNADS